MHNKMRAAAALFFLLSAFSCGGVRNSQKLPLVAGIMPQKYILDRLGGEYLDVSVLVAPGENPHMYNATPRQMDRLLSAKAFFVSGQEFEDVLIDKLKPQLQGVLLVNTIRDIRLRTFKDVVEAGNETGGTRAGGDHGDGAGTHDTHGHGIEDPHSWLDPLIFTRQAKTMSDALCELDPVHADTYRKNYEILSRELAALNEKIAALLLPVKGRVMFVYHPAFGYFTDAYGLVQVAVEAEGKSAGTAELERTIEFIRQKGVKVIFSQPQNPEAGVRALAEALKLRIVVLDPLAYDYPKNLLAMAGEIRQALE
jgi:zinc transport system substrate-binding protein